MIFGVVFGLIFKFFLEQNFETKALTAQKKSTFRMSVDRMDRMDIMDRMDRQNSLNGLNRLD